MDIIAQITSEFHLQAWQVENVVKLIDEGNTIPFIARYRKEAHGTLDDQMLREIAERLEYLRNLDKRREEVRASIEGQEKLTEEISAALSNAATLAEIEDIYRPFKPKRRTRASIAREKGLEPLAQVLYEQRPDCEEPLALALDFLNPEKGVETAEDALKGALDIIAENLSDDATIRRRLRNLFTVCGVVRSKSAKEEDSVYAPYYDFSAPVEKIAGYQVLAIDRGEREGFLKVSVTLDRPRAIKVISSVALKSTESPCTRAVLELSLIHISEPTRPY